MTDKSLEYVPLARMLSDVDCLSVKEIEWKHMQIFLSMCNTQTLLELHDAIEALNMMGLPAALCAVFEDTKGCLPTFEIGVISDET